MSVNYLFSKLLKKISIPAIKNSNIDQTAKVCSYSHVVNTKLGKYSYIGNNCTVINTEIGKFCSIADNCIIGGGSHPIVWVSTSPVFHSGKNIMKKNFSTHQHKTTEKTIIGNDVWLGNNCLIKSGVTIGNGSIIGMGSVLTKDVGDYEIWAGNPARFLRKRFDEPISSKLLNLCWWDYDEQQLMKAAKSFNNVNQFIDEMEEGE